jgi:hypothetical protein
MNMITRIAAMVLAPAAMALALAVPASASATVTRCYTGGLGLSLHRDGAAAGTTYYDVVFTNTSARPCTLAGYPGASARTAPAGPRIGHAATPDPVYRAALVVLAPGGKAHAVLGIGTAADYPGCRPVTAGAVAVYPPGAFHRLARPLTFEACRNRHDRTLTVTIVVPGR